MENDLYLDKIYEVVDKNDDFKWHIVVYEDFTYIDYYERKDGGEYERIESAHQEIRTDAAVLISKAILELASQGD